MENSNLENEPLTENENRLLEIFKSLSDDNQIVLIGDAIKLKREQTYEEALSTNNQYKQAK
ncbi:MAG: hypothetical protein LUG24_03970 [Clostridiales bacterium]|nr:hypothetical protein [Clostridiales bacterium]